MIDVEEFEQKRRDFEIWRIDNQPYFSRMEDLRQTFLRKFPSEKLSQLSVERYVIGKQNKESFCYWLERKLADSGSVRGATSKKFGIYYGVAKNDPTEEYRFALKYGNNAKEAYETVRKALVELLIAGKIKNLEAINNNILSPMFKGKILSVYYPEIYLNVFSKEHLMHFLIKLTVPFSEKENEFLLQQKLVDFKNNDPVMKGWSNSELGTFLYKEFPRASKPAELHPDILDFDVELPQLSKVKPKFISPMMGDITKNTTKKKVGRNVKYKPDYIAQARRNTTVGKRGEDIVLEQEKAHLKKASRGDLAEKVEPVAESDDALGYDVLSFMPDGAEKFIEVKSTTQPFYGKPSFFISANEYKTGCELKEQYYIYWVFKAATKEPEILRLQNPFGLPPDQLSIEPRSYIVGFQFE